jgi:hypothetical protein
MHILRIRRKSFMVLGLALLVLVAASIFLFVKSGSRVKADITGFYVARTDWKNPINLLNVSENGNTETYDLGLLSKPTSIVTVNTSVPWQAEDLSVSPSTLVFTPDDWDKKQTVTVSAVDDNLIEHNPEPRTINHHASSADPNYDSAGRDVGSIVVYVADNDVPGVVISENGGSTNVSED